MRDLAAYLQSAGHQVAVLVGGTGLFVDQVRSRGVAVFTVPSLQRSINPIADIRAILELRRLLKHLQPDVVSTHSSKAGWLGRFAAKTLHLKCVFTAHGWAFTEGVRAHKRILYRLAEALVARLALRIITVSEYDRRLAAAAGVGKTAHVVTVHNGMPETQWRAKPGVEVRPVRAIMVARFDEQKDFGTLLAGLADIGDEPWTLSLIGDGPSMALVRSSVERLGLQGRVEFAGSRTDVAEHLSRAHIFILTSNWEGLPRSIIEAMRAGLPVIASDVGGVGELIEEGKTGFLIARGDARSLANCAKRLVRSAQLRAEMGAAGRLRYEQHFTFDRMVAETLAVYAQVGVDIDTAAV